jgi:hypothetical protein
MNLSTKEIHKKFKICFIVQLCLSGFIKFPQSIFNDHILRYIDKDRKLIDLVKNTENKTA